MSQGWIKLHRSLLDWEWYSDINVKTLFIHLLLKANHKDKKWKGHTIKAGQLLTGRKALSVETGLSEQQIRSALNKLKSTGEITIKSTNRSSVITLPAWESYQLDNQQTTQQATNKQPTDNQQITTNKNVKNGENDNKTPKSPGGDDDLFGGKDEEKSKPVPYKKIKEEYNKILFDRPQIEIMSETRMKKLRSLWGMDDNFQSLEFWSGLFTYIRDSDFLMGKTANYPGCNFDFILQQSSFIKIYEGFYHQEAK